MLFAWIVSWAIREDPGVCLSLCLCIRMIGFISVDIKINIEFGMVASQSSRNVANRSNKRWPDRKIIEKYWREDNNLFWQVVFFSFRIVRLSIQNAHINACKYARMRAALVRTIVFFFLPANKAKRKCSLLKMTKKTFQMVMAEMRSNEEKLPLHWMDMERLVVVS